MATQRAVDMPPAKSTRKPADLLDNYLLCFKIRNFFQFMYPFFAHLQYYGKTVENQIYMTSMRIISNVFCKNNIHYYWSLKLKKFSCIFVSFSMNL